jgi:two-component system, sensor histidine kinase and response regulator
MELQQMKSQTESKGHILLIDDEWPICTAVCGLLELAGYTIDYALSAEEGLKYLEDHPETDLVLLDINLGSGLSGIEALPVFRERFKYVQVMMFTSHDTLSTGLECMKKGACDYLTKPFSEQEFLKKFPEALAKKTMARLNDLYLGILVHDLKNPLQCIVGAWDVAKMYMPKTLTDPQKRVLATGDSGISQIKTMIDNILCVSKLEAGTLVMTKEKIEVEKEVEGTVGPFRTQITGSARSFSLTYNENGPHVIVSDRELFSRVLYNILCNAMRFTPPQGAISVTVGKNKDGLLEIGVTNTGSFIDERVHESIFDKFSNVHLSKQASEIRNFGLGLTFSKMAVEMMGGRIWVECDNNLPSTTFYFTIKNQEGSETP